MKQAVLCASVLFLCATSGHAQIIQSVNRFTTVGESEAKAGEAVATGQQSAGVKVLSQGNLDASADGTKVGIQAADLWLNRYLRFYGRLTLPLTDTSASQNTANGPSSGSVATTSSTPKLSATARQQLVDPYGGLLNLSGGLFVKLNRSAAHKTSVALSSDQLLQFRTTLKTAPTDPEKKSTQTLTHTQFMVAAGVENLKQTSQPPTTVADVNSAATQLQDPHGLFLDWRLGLKFIDLPGSGDSNPDVSGTKVSVFYTNAIGLKLIAPLYNAEPTGNTTTDSLHRTGGLTLGGYAVLNYAADSSQSNLFPSVLKSSTWAATGVLGWDLPSTDVASLTFSFTPWTNNTQIGKTFVFGLTLKRTANSTPSTPKQ